MGPGLVSNRAGSPKIEIIEDRGGGFADGFVTVVTVVTTVATGLCFEPPQPARMSAARAAAPMSFSCRLGAGMRDRWSAGKRETITLPPRAMRKTMSLLTVLCALGAVSEPVFLESAAAAGLSLRRAAPHLA